MSNAQTMRGPGRRRMQGGPKSKNPKKTLKRLFGILWKDYKLSIVVVIISIAISSLTGVIGNLFLQRLIDDYILPFLGESNPSFAPLLHALLVMAGIYYIGTVATFLYARIMISVTQGVLKEIRDKMFAHMEKLPIKYFDTHVHGDIMSCYTNDTDTLRQMISQSIPQMMSSSITIVSTFVSMLILSVPLTLLIVLMVLCMECILSGSRNH